MRSPLLLAAGAVLLGATACNRAPEGLSISLEPADPYTLDSLQVVIGTEAVDPNGGDAVSYRYAWTVDGSRMQDLTEASVPSSVTTKGQAWEVEVTPWDGKLTGTPSIATVTILNSLPTATVEVDPQAPRTEDDVDLEVGSADKDNDSIAFRYEWSLNGSVTSLTSDTLRANRTNKGEQWEVSVYPNDGEADGEPAVASFTIANTPPEVAKARVVSDAEPPTASSALTCAGSGWSDVDGDEEGYRVQWYVNGVVDGAEAQLSGSFIRGDSVHCQLTPFDGDDEGEPVISDAVLIRNAPPSLDSVTIGPEDPKDGTSVEATLGASFDGDGDPISFEYSWRIAGREVATSEELAATRFRRDDEIVLWVTPTDGYDNGTAVKSNAVVGGNNLPILTSANYDLTEVYTNDVLAVEFTSKDYDGDDVTVSVDWYVNSTKISATGATLDGAAWFDHFDKVYAVVHPDDGADLGLPITLATLEIKNSPPTEPELVLDPAEPKDGDDLLCKIDGVSTDADLDGITYTFRWTVDGTPVTGSKSVYTNDTLDGADWELEQDVVCTVTPNDGYDDGEPGETGIGIWEGTATFTTCGKTGPTGPGQSDCDTSYKGTALEKKVTVVTGIQEFKVPSSGTYRIEAWGAQGGTCGRTSGCEGAGARMRGDFKLSSGDLLRIIVGQKGGSKGFGGGGGGGTFVVEKGGSNLVIAGGGGGGGHSSNKGTGGTTASCGTAGGLTSAGAGGCAGLGGTSSSGSGGAGSYNNSGGGGGVSGSGVGNGTKTNPGISFAAGGAGGLDTGGFGGGGGGISHAWNCTTGNGGGSGGGGYSGGGGGGSNCNGQGGGGGSFNGGTGASNSSGVNRADGKVVITKL